MGFNILYVLLVLQTPYFIKISTEIFDLDQIQSVVTGLTSELEEWAKFKIIYRKNYCNLLEELLGKENFLRNLHFITKSNKMNLPFKLRVNKYCDYAHNECLKYRCGLRTDGLSRRKRNAVIINKTRTGAAPNAWDWRNVNGNCLVSDIEDQGKCGCCYTFVACHQLVAQIMITQFVETKSQPSQTCLSKQELLDCTHNYSNKGCDGGLMNNCFRYIKDKNGILLENTYPYEGKSESCRCNARHNVVTIRSIVTYTQVTVEELKYLVWLYGPVSCGIFVSEYFVHYWYGVLDDPTCKGQSQIMVNHAVLIVGYGVDDDGIEYWIIKNSWGTQWGEDGYVRVHMRNNCGITVLVSIIEIHQYKPTHEWWGT